MTGKNRPVELLSPAKDCAIGIEAIRHGADAVYIGAPRFGARQAAGNSVSDIARLVHYAHLFEARVYVALNTILKDEELPKVERMVVELYRAGVDALIVQDMALLELDLPPIALHASTQTDNRTPEKVRFLEQSGFSQVVLARELSLDQIRAIRRETAVPLEAFVHGALCVSYSGQCYMSCAMNGRSANRGECAQYCRLPYTLKDGDGRVVVAEKHLLSLKDLNQSERLEQMLDAGITSLKIEGRLKDMGYVKNCTAYYRRQLDTILARRPEYVRSSCGRVELNFQPSPEKSFNRGFTRYFLDGVAKEGLISPDTPKSVGESVGCVKELSGRSFTVSGIVSLHNGDGLCFRNRQGCFEGFRINRVEGNRVFPASDPELLSRTPLFRNFDQQFDKLLSSPQTAVRSLAVDMDLSETAQGFSLTVTDETGVSATACFPMEKEPARSDQQENLLRQLGKLGDTPFTLASFRTHLSGNWFIPSSLLSTLRREAIESLLSVKEKTYKRPVRPDSRRISWGNDRLSYLGNVSNEMSRRFYSSCGVTRIDPAYELSPQGDVPLMYTRYCLRKELGYCLKASEGKALKEPLTLHYNQQAFRLSFDCGLCEMRIYKE